jgi:hypothetical protein
LQELRATGAPRQLGLERAREAAEASAALREEALQHAIAAHRRAAEAHRSAARVAEELGHDEAAARHHREAAWNDDHAAELLEATSGADDETQRAPDTEKDPREGL